MSQDGPAKRRELAICSKTKTFQAFTMIPF